MLFAQTPRWSPVGGAVGGYFSHAPIQNNSSKPPENIYWASAEVILGKARSPMAVLVPGASDACACLSFRWIRCSNTWAAELPVILSAAHKGLSTWRGQRALERVADVAEIGICSTINGSVDPRRLVLIDKLQIDVAWVTPLLAYKFVLKYPRDFISLDIKFVRNYCRPMIYKSVRLKERWISTALKKKASERIYRVIIFYVTREVVFFLVQGVSRWALIRNFWKTIRYWKLKIVI